MSTPSSILRVPMPIPRTTNAPLFNGKFVTDFLSLLTQHGANAGITDLDDLVPYIVQYSSDEVKDLIHYLPEFDPDETTKTYKAAKDALMLLYGQADEPPNFTESMLCDFCQDQSAKSPYKNKKEIETYHQEFMKIAGPFESCFSPFPNNYYFVTGIPSVLKEWFMTQVPEKSQTDSLLFEPWKEENTPRERKSQPSRSKQREDVIMRDAKRPEKSIPAYHFTSDIQDLADPKALLQKIFDLDISVPLFQLIGSSPALQKLLGEATRLRRDYNTKSAEYSPFDSDEFAGGDSDAVESAHTEVIAQRRVYVENTDRLPEFLLRYSNAIARIPEKQYFAMTTGTLTISIGAVEFTAMIDTGSELNLAGRSVPTRASLPIDFEGMKWSLKGIHGSPEQLQGCSTDIPMGIGRHDFRHHLFISHQELGNHDIILGQPFLQWFASRIDHDRGGSVNLYLWKDGDRKTRSTVVISITDPSDPRNTTAITTRDDCSHHHAWVEEVTDEEDFRS
ncbi:hypothetical protein DFH07DRAFT_971908 [Mycena maculata]|uniref:DUF4100 domain-containing protein n=1 Tax=Mycena maculata TaxID=230809 RepID=A0AAD7HKN5_9AGAR|nr:hypothetical protein DFH07DRAFT_971908 [Mycena maculata]